VQIPDRMDRGHSREIGGERGRGDGNVYHAFSVARGVESPLLSPLVLSIPILRWRREIICNERKGKIWSAASACEIYTFVATGSV
jgi:hypothetical protein